MSIEKSVATHVETTSDAKSGKPAMDRVRAAWRGEKTPPSATRPRAVMASNPLHTPGNAKFTGLNKYGARHDGGDGR